MSIAAPDALELAAMPPIRSVGRLAFALCAAILGIAATTALGVWQTHRATEKLNLQASVAKAASAAPRALVSADFANPETLAYSHVVVRGRWLPDRVVYLDNRPYRERSGLYVMMPLAIDGARDAAANLRTIIVNRGWVPRDAADRARIAPYATPGGVVQVAGVVLTDEPRLLELGVGAEKKLGGIWQNFDFDAFAAASRSNPLHLIVRQDQSASGVDYGSVDGLVRDWPDRGGALQGQIDRHRGYAFQWFLLAALIVALTCFHLFGHVRNSSHIGIR